MQQHTCAVGWSGLCMRAAALSGILSATIVVLELSGVLSAGASMEVFSGDLSAAAAMLSCATPSVDLRVEAMAISGIVFFVFLLGDDIVNCE